MEKVTLGNSPISMEIQECGRKLCAYMVENGKCSGNVILPYDKYVYVDQTSRMYIWYVKEIIEPHFIMISRNDDWLHKDKNIKTIDQKRKWYKLFIKGGSFSYYRLYGDLTAGEISLALDSDWSYEGAPSCSRK